MTSEAQNKGPRHKSDRLSTALGWTVASNVAQEGILSVVALVLAALLKPSEFGTVALALIYISFVQLITGLGFGTALVQKKEVSDVQFDSIFWVTGLIGVILCGISMALSGWWASVNHAPELRMVTSALALVIPIDSCSIVQEAILQRRMNFKALALRKNLSSIVGGVVGITAAFIGWGIWALVIQQLVRSASSAFFVWKSSDYRPSFRFCKQYVYELFGYSSKVLAGSFGVFAQSYMDSLLMGLFCGPTAVGLYRMADRLVEMALKLVTRAFQVVALPHFSQLQDDIPALNQSLGLFYRSSGIVTIPALAFLVAASPAIMDALGPQWTAAGPVLRILSVIGLVKTVTLFIGPLLQAVSRPGVCAWMVWTLAGLNAIGIGCFAMYMPDRTAEVQAYGIAILRASLFALVFLPLNLYVAAKFTRINLSVIWIALGPCFATAFVVGGIVIPMLSFRGEGRTNAMIFLLITGTLSTLCIGVSAFFFAPQFKNKLLKILRRVGFGTLVTS